jgi:hypothetical protein
MASDARRGDVVMSDPVSQPTILAYLSTGPCRQRPGALDRRVGKVMTTCSECPGLMWAGDCKRDELREALSWQAHERECEQAAVALINERKRRA